MVPQPPADTDSYWQVSIDVDRFRTYVMTRSRICWLEALGWPCVRRGSITGIYDYIILLYYKKFKKALFAGGALGPCFKHGALAPIAIICGETAGPLIVNVVRRIGIGRTLPAHEKSILNFFLIMKKRLNMTYFLSKYVKFCPSLSEVSGFCLRTMPLDSRWKLRRSWTPLNEKIKSRRKRPLWASSMACCLWQ